MSRIVTIPAAHTSAPSRPPSPRHRITPAWRVWWSAGRDRRWRRGRRASRRAGSRSTRRSSSRRRGAARRSGSGRGSGTCRRRCRGSWTPAGSCSTRPADGVTTSQWGHLSDWPGLYMHVKHAGITCLDRGKGLTVRYYKWERDTFLNNNEKPR